MCICACVLCARPDCHSAKVPLLLWRAQVGVVWAEPSRRGPDDSKSLHQLSFQTGDFLDVAIL